MKGDEQCDKKQIPTTFGAAPEERELTLIKLRSTSTKSNQVSGLTIR